LVFMVRAMFMAAGLTAVLLVSLPFTKN
jgi:hypothetical protein